MIMIMLLTTNNFTVLKSLQVFVIINIKAIKFFKFKLSHCKWLERCKLINWLRDLNFGFVILLISQSRLNKLLSLTIEFLIVNSTLCSWAKFNLFKLIAEEDLIKSWNVILTKGYDEIYIHFLLFKLRNSIFNPDLSQFLNYVRIVINFWECFQNDISRRFFKLRTSCCLLDKQIISIINITTKEVK